MGYLEIRGNGGIVRTYWISYQDDRGKYQPTCLTFTSKGCKIKTKEL